MDKKEVLLSRLKQLKKDVVTAKGMTNESVVALANQLINCAKEYYKEDLSDLEPIETKDYGSPRGKNGSWPEVSAKLGQAIAVLENDIEGPADCVL